MIPTCLYGEWIIQKGYISFEDSDTYIEYPWTLPDSILIDNKS